MRKILFRGYSRIFQKWLYGNLIVIDGSYHIDEKDIEEDGHHLHQHTDKPTWVDVTSVGQFTGIYDYEGKMVYEGDIIASVNDKHYIVYSERRGAFVARHMNADIECSLTQEWMNTCEKVVVGNTTESKEVNPMEKAFKIISDYFSRLEQKTKDDTIKNAMMGAEWMFKHKNPSGLYAAMEEYYPIPKGGRDYMGAWMASAFEKGAWVAEDLMK